VAGKELRVVQTIEEIAAALDAGEGFTLPQSMDPWRAWRLGIQTAYLFAKQRGRCICIGPGYDTRCPVHRGA